MYVPTGHTLVESQKRSRQITLNQRGIDVELTSLPSGLILYLVSVDLAVKIKVKR